ncbi:MAG: hypothetical protein ACTSW1_05895 [Candidatus Hodarchaeales archaeon]
MGLPDCLSELVGKWVTPPRNEVFNIEAQRYLIIRMNEPAQGVDCRFESGTTIRFHYWRFNHVIDMLNKTKTEYIPLGSSYNPDQKETIEGSLMKEAKEKGYPSAGLRTAPFICDLIVLCGYGEYGYTRNQKTGRKVQGIRKTAKLD